MYRAMVEVPGSCGELAQGLLRDFNVMVTCPVDLYSRVEVILSPGYSLLRVEDKGNQNRGKALRAVQMVLARCSRKELGGIIRINSQLLTGRGMGSSTADIAGAAACTFRALGYEIDPDLVKEIALQIEPSDGTFLRGINCFDHIEGKVEYCLGEPPPLRILIFTEEGSLDTVGFNRRRDLHRLKKAKEKAVRESVNYLAAGIRNGDGNLVGRGATLSSWAHQPILYRPYLKEIIQLIERIPGLCGVNIAHSGTVMGLLMTETNDSSRVIKLVENRVDELRFVTEAKLIGGGIKEENHASYPWGQYRSSKTGV